MTGLLPLCQAYGTNTSVRMRDLLVGHTNKLFKRLYMNVTASHVSYLSDVSHYTLLLSEGYHSDREKPHTY
jgi:hypothetical protein